MVWRTTERGCLRAACERTFRSYFCRSSCCLRHRSLALSRRRPPARQLRPCRPLWRPLPTPSRRSLASENLRRAALARIADPRAPGASRTRASLSWGRSSMRSPGAQRQRQTWSNGSMSIGNCGSFIVPPRPLPIEPRRTGSERARTRWQCPRRGRPQWRERPAASGESAGPGGKSSTACDRSKRSSGMRATAFGNTRSHALLALDRAVALQVRIADAHALVYRQQERIVSQRMLSERSSLWQLGATSANFDVVAAEFHVSWRSLREYLAREGAALAGPVHRRPGADNVALHQKVRLRIRHRHSAATAGRWPHRCSSH